MEKYIITPLLVYFGWRLLDKILLWMMPNNKIEAIGKYYSKVKPTFPLNSISIPTKKRRKGIAKA